MLILTIETSTPVERVAVVRDGAVVVERTETVGRGHTERLLGVVESVLDESGTGLADLDALAVSIGPGRFSGLRVGLATAKGLAASKGLPLVPVESLAALAESARPATGLVCPMLDARRGEVYGALFRLGAGRERLTEDAALSPDEMIERARAASGGEAVLFLGSGAVMCADEIASAAGVDARFPEVEVTAPAPSAIAAIAEEGGGLDPSEAAVLEPVYLRGI